MIKLYDENPNQNTISKIVEVLRNGGVIVYPTDTVYALGCDIFQARAIEKICKIKSIDPHKAQFSVMCASLSDISEYTKMDNETFKLIRRNTPGMSLLLADSMSERRSCKQTHSQTHGTFPYEGPPRN